MMMMVKVKVTTKEEKVGEGNLLYYRGEGDSKGQNLPKDKESLSLQLVGFWKSSGDMARNPSMAKTLVFCFVCSVIVPSALLWL